MVGPSTDQALPVIVAVTNAFGNTGSEPLLVVFTLIGAYVGTPLLVIYKLALDPLFRFNQLIVDSTPLPPRLMALSIDCT